MYPGILTALAGPCSGEAGSGTSDCQGCGGAQAPRPCAKRTPRETKALKMTGSGSAQGEGNGTQILEGPVAGKPSGDFRDLDAGQGRQRGANDVGYNSRRRHTARGAERVAEAGQVGGCGRRPSGRRSMPCNEVGSGCKGDMLRQQPLLMGCSRRGRNKTAQKSAKTGREGE